jgi:uncharacterized membrane protein YeaQ/YmgE (transglycosylase-associated protein family)
MGIISWIILGLITGFIGAKIVNREGQGFWLDIALGIVGALVGGFLFNLFGASGVTGLNIYCMIVAVIGSAAVLLVYNAVTGRRRVLCTKKTRNYNPIGGNKWPVSEICSARPHRAATSVSRCYLLCLHY